MHLEREIHEQADVIGRLLQDGAANFARIASAVRAFEPAHVVIAARGTSDNAARYAQYLFGAHTGLSVGLSAPSLHTMYKTPPNLSRALVIGISQSGRAEDVLQVLRDANEQGALTVSITNDPESPLALAGQYHVDLMAGEEISIAATKTYTAQLTAIAALVTALTDEQTHEHQLMTLPNVMRDTLKRCENIPMWAGRYRYMTQFAVIGRGFNYATAFEISLKIKELCYITGEGFSEADFRHGPIAVVASGFPVIAIAPHGVVLPTMLDLLEKLSERDAELLVISNDERALAQGLMQMPLPDVAEWLSPIVAVVPGQIFAMTQAQVRGYAVDKPRGLSKVTVTQ